MTQATERRETDRRKGVDRRVNIDSKYKESGKEKRVFQARRKGTRRKSASAFVTCRECGNLFLITKDEFYKLIHEGKPVLCPKGCKKDNTKVAKTVLFMAERGGK
ncbi:MAG: hypothetical protein A2Z59_11210 [Nitrospinae bacterium RIFCSPLOWO2_02_39_17]|nr:MAG: hypothetical protein A2Z59_11210 [Nitrospinae bacterium RIFCSPLOWO2_02_39_17]